MRNVTEYDQLGIYTRKKIRALTGISYPCIQEWIDLLKPGFNLEQDPPPESGEPFSENWLIAFANLFTARKVLEMKPRTYKIRVVNTAKVLRLRLAFWNAYKVCSLTMVKTTLARGTFPDGEPISEGEMRIIQISANRMEQENVNNNSASGNGVGFGDRRSGIDLQSVGIAS